MRLLSGARGWRRVCCPAGGRGMTWSCGSATRSRARRTFLVEANETRRGGNPGEEGTPMLRVVTDDDGRAELRSALDEICAEGARRMQAGALEAEVDAYVAALADERDERGHRLVVRNGHAEARRVTTGVGAIEVQAPRVDDRR